MAELAGTKYVSSGKFNPLECLLWTLTGIVAAFGIGWIYGFISHVNPIIYLNALLLIGVVFVLIAATKMMIEKGKSRNKLVNFIMAVIMAVVAWYVSWCYMWSDVTGENIFGILARPADVFEFLYEYASVVQIYIGKTGSSGSAVANEILYVVYGLEFLAFMAAPFICLSIKNYYCEDCHETLREKVYYMKDVVFVGEHLTDALNGNFEFVMQTQHAENLESLDLENLVVYKFEFHYCENCNKSSIANLEHITLKIKDGKVNVDKTNLVVKDTYMTDSSTYILLNPQPTATLAEVKEAEIEETI